MKIKSVLILLGIILVLILVVGCIQQYICSNGKKVNNPNLCDVCGDGKCTGAETNCNCHSDCGPQTGGVIKIRQQCSEAAPVYDAQTGACINVNVGYNCG